MKFFPHIAYIILLCLLPGTGRSNNASYYFKQIAIEQGLSQSSINSILCDHKGILWIGTKSGLNCYDQHELKSFFNDNLLLKIRSIIFGFPPIRDWLNIIPTTTISTRL